MKNKSDFFEMAEKCGWTRLEDSTQFIGPVIGPGALFYDMEGYLCRSTHPWPVDGADEQQAEWFESSLIWNCGHWVYWLELGRMPDVPGIQTPPKKSVFVLGPLYIVAYGPEQIPAILDDYFDGLPPLELLEELDTHLLKLDDREEIEVDGVGLLSPGLFAHGSETGVVALLDWADEAVDFE